MVSEDEVAATRDRAQPRLMRAALEAATRGWYVFPLHVRAKTPSLRSNWEHVATTDPDTIWRWWDTAPFNIGIATGRSGLVVVDLDPAHADQPPPDWAAERVTHGRQVFEILARRAGQPTPIDTFTVATPRGGNHLYFTAPHGQSLRNTAGRLGWHIDTRAHGGYVVGPASVVNGRPYHVTRDVAPAPLPAWIGERLRERPPAPRTPFELVEGHYGAYGQAALRGEAERVTRATLGTRNHTLFTAAARLGELVAGHVIGEADACYVLHQACATHLGVAGFTEPEATRTIDSGLRRGARSPRTPLARPTTARPERPHHLPAQRTSRPATPTQRFNQR